MRGWKPRLTGQRGPSEGSTEPRLVVGLEQVVDRAVVVSDGRLYVGGGNRAVPDIGLDDAGSVSCYALPGGGIR